MPSPTHTPLGPADVNVVVSQITNPCLKVELQSKLDLPPRLTGRGGNLAERGSADERRWRVVWENHVRCSPETMLVVAKP
jgi:hypothetical protein